MVISSTVDVLKEIATSLLLVYLLGVGVTFICVLLRGLFHWYDGLLYSLRRALLVGVLWPLIWTLR